ncbi:MAG TPA: carboxypeptidase regulatory-like domain-containing protein [Pyrinomonadaceae bacterium]|nr:carboxypeptidase regulatory-like domain-containing protein [Pyrinomonadaceae bacterium]
MKRSLLLVVVCVFSITASAQTRRVSRTAVSPAANTNSNIQTLPIRRVILYSNGVAYIERRGTITGHAEINLSFKQSQVDDVLKSMVVLDLGQGRIGAVSYNSSAPPAARLADIPFSIEPGTNGNEQGGLAGILRQLQGAQVMVTTATRSASGSILTVEERKAQPDPNHPAVNRPALVITSANGELISFDLAEVRSIKIIDEGAKRDISEFAHASASARRRDAKTIVVTSDGSGAREMLVSYTIAAPIWKTTYRVVLDAKNKPFFQGWAIVDNVSDEDWKNVSLSLISGSPVSFIQPIQKPLYRYRPVVPMPDDLNLDPQVYEDGEGENSGAGVGRTISGRVTDPMGAVVAGATVTITNTSNNQSTTVTTSDRGTYRSPVLSPGTYSVRIESPGFKILLIQNLAVGGYLPSYANAALEVGGVSETVTVTANNNYLSTMQQQISQLPLNNRANNYSNLVASGLKNNTSLEGVSLSDAITSSDSGVEAAATGSEVGDLFEYRIDQPITVPRDRSALIPILQTRVDGERVSIFNEGSRPDRPMSGMLLVNTSPLTLESGALTVIDGDAYAGEALMERLKPAEKRLISFALDLATLVHVRTKEDRAPTFLVRVVNGVFQAHYHQTNKKIYVLTNQTDKPRVVYVEHPLRDGWALSDDTQQPEGKSARYYRFRVALAPHEKVELPVTERRALMDTYALHNFSRPDLELFISRRYIDAATRTILEKIIDLKTQMAMTSSRIEAIDREVEEIGEDQQRLRDNIKALTATAEARQLISRYVAKADTQETRLEQINKEKQELNANLNRLQVELQGVVQSLALDRKLTN